MKKILMMTMCLALIPMLFAGKATFEPETSTATEQLQRDQSQPVTDMAPMRPRLYLPSQRMIRVCPTPERAIRPTPTRVQPTSRQEDTLSYDNQTNVTSIGMNTAGVRWAGAVRFTPTELGPYTGWDLIAVVYYHATYTTIDDTVKIMSDTLPAAVLLSQGFTSIPGAWNRIDLTTPIPIDGVSDLWLAIWLTEQPGGFPLGAGPGPYVPEKGIWVWEPGFGWYDLGPFLDYNWNIWAIVAPAGGSTGGPDDFGYEWIDSDVSGGPVFNWIEINSTGTATNAMDDDEIWPIPFPGFTYYGMTFDTIGISSNGAIYFEDLTYWPLSNYQLPYSSYTEQFMALYWDDLNPGTAGYGEIYWEVIGDQLVIEWDSVVHYGTSDYLKAEIILDRTTGDILFQYLMATSEAGSGGTVGIQGSGTEPPAWYLQYSYDSVALHDSLAIRFYYTPPDHDVGCSAILSPPEGTVPANDYDVIGRIRNYGSAMETFDVTANVFDTVGMIPVFTATVTLTDFPVAGDSNVNFGQVTFNPDSYYYTIIYTELVGDINPANDTSAIYSTTAMTLGDIIFEMDIGAITGWSSHLGIEFDGTYFYVTSVTPTNVIHVIDTLGNLIYSIPQGTTTSWGMRDLAWDGVYAGADRIDTLYASDDNGTYQFGIDLATGTMDAYPPFTGPPGVLPCRGLGWDDVDEWFFTANWDPLYKFTKDGTVIQGPVTGPGSVYGCAYDNEDSTIWWHGQTGPYSCHLTQMYPSDMTVTGVTLDIPHTVSLGTAGGLCYHHDFQGMDVLFAIVQATHIYGIFLRPALGIEERPETKTPVSFGFAPMTNPTKGSAISYITTTQGNVSLKVYDGTGRLVETLVNSVQPAGVNTVNWDTRNIANGVYFFKLEAENQHATHKLILIK
jgi:hypothetical protein